MGSGHASSGGGSAPHHPAPPTTSPPEAEGRRAWQLAAGCVAGLAAAAAASWLRLGLEGTPRLVKDTWPFTVAHLLAGSGLVAAGVCALALARRAQALSWRSLWGFALAAQAVALASAALDSEDVFANLAFGALRHAGRSAYAVPPAALVDSPITPLVSRMWVNDPSPYGPLFHSVVWAAAGVGHALGSPLWGSFFAYKAILGAALVATLGLAARHLVRTRPAEAKEIWTYLALAPILAWETTGQGHNDGLLVVAVTAFVAAASAGRAPLAVAALAGGVAVKYALAPLLGLYLLLVARRSLLRALALGALAAVVVAAAFAPEWRDLTLRSVMPMVGGDATRHARSFTSMVCLVLGWVGQGWRCPAVYRALSLGSGLVGGALLLRTAWRARTLDELAHGYLLFLVALYLTVPWFQPWYVCWAMPLLLVERDARWIRTLAAFGVVTMAQWLTTLDPFTSVACDLWLLWQVWTMRRSRAPDAATATPSPARPC